MIGTWYTEDSPSDIITIYENNEYVETDGRTGISYTYDYTYEDGILTLYSYGFKEYAYTVKVFGNKMTLKSSEEEKVLYRLKDEDYLESYSAYLDYLKSQDGNHYEYEAEDHTHMWTVATCEEDGYCTICYEIYQEATGHDWVNGACEEYGYCRICNKTAPEPTAHNYKDGYCERCGSADWENFGFYEMYSRNIWIEVNGCNLGEGYVYIRDYNQERGNKKTDLYRFNDIYYESYNLTVNQLYQDMDIGPRKGTASNYVFTVTDNNVIESDRGKITIFDRIIYDGNIVLKTKDNGEERWFALADEIEFNKVMYGTVDGEDCQCVIFFYR